MRRLSQRTWLITVTVLGLASSAGGIGYAVAFGEAADGSRGGAIAVAISFAALFAARNTPKDVLAMTDPPSSMEELQKSVRTLRTALATLIDSQGLEKRYLTASSVSGTLVWGFGDIIARWLGATP